ncbi:MNIO family bufferin maturase [Taklimakanibacter deserti]|uniref:MNIO family bufferin maturase n=1 Tax=Taklimakanibacter deserti TaxID=2267839 RepID=UPI000E64E536
MKRTHLPRQAGVGFKPQHFTDIAEGRQPVGFFEVHAENYMGDGGLPHAQLNRIRENYALSLHGVGLSIGSMQDLDRDHLARLSALCERYQPESFSEHLAWSSHGTVFLNDLLPLPYTQQTLDRIVEHVDQVQSALRRQMLLENPATYLLFAESTIAETDFLNEIARRTGCGLLLDVNNVFVSATNHQLDATAYIAAFPLQHVGEIHLSGHAATEDETGAPLLIDTHDTPVTDPVWSLYQSVIATTGPIASLVEWDDKIPAWPVLRAEAEAAQAILDRAPARRAA